MYRVVNVQLWKMHESKVDSHKRSQYYVAEPEIDRESVAVEDYGGSELPM